MKERLQKIISSHGIASRRTAEKLIEDGKVTVNGAVAHIGDSADPDIDDIIVSGAVISQKPRTVVIMLNKPRGYVSTMSDERGRKTVFDLVRSCGVRVYPIGRLDIDSEGLLLMTNDGELANQLMHPKYEVSKAYLAKVEGDIEAAYTSLCSPMVIDGHKIKPATVEVESKDTLVITVTEGRNRQVRKMCGLTGLEVKRLKRVSEGPLELGKLPAGKWRELSDEEIKQLKAHIK